MSDKDRRFTLTETDLLCRSYAQVTHWDLDVAAEEARHLAPWWFDEKTDGLKQKWKAQNVWCNPPFSDIEPWVIKAWHSLYSGRSNTIAMLLPANRTEQPWWQEHIEPFRDWSSPEGRLRTYFLPKRVRFGSPEDPRGEKAGSPPFGCVLLVWHQSL